MNFKHSFFLSATVLLVAASGAFAQVKKTPTPSPKSKPVSPAKQVAPPANTQALPTDPLLLKGTLPNGLTYYIRNTGAAPKQADMLLINKAGSVIETDAQRGFSHAITHLAIKEAAAFMQQTGVKLKADSNALNSYDNAVYKFNLRVDTLDGLNKGLDLLALWAGQMRFDDADVADVKVTATDELKQALNTSKYRLDKAALPFLLNNSRYSLRHPKGEEATVAAADATGLKNFYADWYRPNLQAIIVVGDVDVKKVEELIKTKFAVLKNPAAPKPVTTYPLNPVTGTPIKFITDKDLEYVITQVVIKQPRAAAKTPAGFNQSVKLSLFNEMLAWRMDEITQQSNSPFLLAQAGYNGFIGNDDAFIATAVANARNVETAMKAIAEEIERIRKFGFVATELERAKQNAIQQVVYEYQNRDNIMPFSIAADYQNNFLTGATPTGLIYKYNYIIDNIGKIDLAAMNALAAKLLTDQNRIVLVQAPETEKAQLPTEQALRGWFTGATAAISAYEDNASVPLMNKLPIPGKVTETRTDSVILATYLTLSNGAKVILKPTQFQGGQIIMNGFAPGGTSLASDQDFPSANLAARLITLSGVADFNLTQLERMLRNKGVNVAPYTSDVLHGFTGFSSIDDFETSMQLLHLYFTQPRKDASAWQRLIADIKAELVLRGADELAMMQDTVAAILSGYNPRGMTTTIPQLNAASIDKAYQFYKDRYANAGNFTFTFTGAFTNEAILPYIEAYIGSLPANGATETFKNTGMRPPTGNITKTLVKGKGQSAVSQLIFNGTYDYSAVNNVDLDAVERILYLKIAQRITDTIGITQVYVTANYTKTPESRYRITVGIECPVADLDKMTTLVLDEVNKFKQSGAEQKELNTFILEEARSVQSQMRQNAFWSSALNVTAQNGTDPHEILQHAQLLQQVDIARTKAAANKYLSGANLIKVTLLPENK